MNTIKVRITDEELYNILDSAFASGISYWCVMVEVTKRVAGAHYLGEHVVNGGALELTDDEGHKHTLNKAKMLKGLSLYQHHNFDDFDAYDVDRVVQLAIYGHVVYA